MTDTSLDEVSEAIARRVAKRKVAEINRRVAELLEQEFAESGDAADEPERDETGSETTRETAPAQINGTLDVPALLPSPEPAKSIDPDQSAAGGVLIPSMVAKQSGEFEAGETTAASAQGASSPVLCAPADPAAVEGDCGHEPPAFISGIPGEGASGTAREAPSAGSGGETLQVSSGVQLAPPQQVKECAERDSDGVGAHRIAASPAPLRECARVEKGTVTPVGFPEPLIGTAIRPAGPGMNSADRDGGVCAPSAIDAGERATGPRSSASVLAHSVGPAPPVSKHFELPDIPAFLRRKIA